MCVLLRRRKRKADVLLLHSAFCSSKTRHCRTRARISGFKLRRPLLHSVKQVRAALVIHLSPCALDDCPCCILSVIHFMTSSFLSGFLTQGEDRTPRRTHIFLSCRVWHARLSTFLSHACVAYKSAQVNHTCDVWFAPNADQNTSSSMMSHPNLLGLHPESFSSFYSTPPHPPQRACSTISERASLTGISHH